MAKLRQLPLVIGALIFLSCMRGPAPIANYGRNGDGRADKWKYKISQAVTQYTFDTNFDSHPDLIKTYRNNDLIQVERDRNCDGRINLVKEYQHGKLVRMVRDDNFDGKRGTINTYRNGKLAIVEHDSDECGSVDRADYYDDSRKLIRSEIRKPGPLSRSK